MPHIRKYAATVVAVGALTALSACSSNTPAATTTSPSAPSATTPGTQTPGTTKPTGTTTPSTGVQANKWQAKTEDGSSFSGSVECTTGDGDTVNLLFANKDDVKAFTVTLPDGFAGGKGDAVIYSTTKKTESGTGAASVTVATGGGDVTVFSFSVGYRLNDNSTGSLSGSGACKLDENMLPKPPTGADADPRLAMPPTDAKAFATALADVGSKNYSSVSGAKNAWVAAGINPAAMVGYGVAATPKTISGFEPVTSKTLPYDEVLPYAVADQSSGCAYGILLVGTGGSPVTSRVVVAPDGAACTGGDALDYFETN